MWITFSCRWLLWRKLLELALNFLLKWKLCHFCNQYKIILTKKPSSFIQKMVKENPKRPQLKCLSQRINSECNKRKGREPSTRRFHFFTFSFSYQQKKKGAWSYLWSEQWTAPNSGCRNMDQPGACYTPPTAQTPANHQSMTGISQG